MNNAKVSLGGHRSDVAGNPRKNKVTKTPNEGGSERQTLTNKIFKSNSLPDRG